jgi:hypothetical protein
LLADGDDLLDYLVHLGDGDCVVGGVVGAKDYQVHRLNLYAIMLFEHVAIEILLDAVVVERGVGQADAIAAHAATKGLYYGLALSVDYLR